MKYKMANSFLEVEINRFGAELSSIKKKNDVYEYLWQGDAHYWKRQAPILFPIVGKLVDNTYFYGEETYHMTQHGFARDCEFEVVVKKDTFVSLKLNHTPESLLKYPFKFELILSYELKDTTLIVGYHVKNLNDMIMPFSIGAHPAFNWNEEAFFEFDKTVLKTYAITEEGISSDKKEITIEDHKLLITEELFKDDALIFDDIDKVKYTFGKRSIEMTFADFPYVGLWSKPSGAPFICIEPWQGIADFVDHNQRLLEKEGIQLLNPNAVFKSEYTIKIS